MELAGTRFGTIEFDEHRAISLPGGLIGFAEEKRFILLEPPPGRRVAWLQSLLTPELAFPVIAGIAFGREYPQPSAVELARRAQLLPSPDSEVAVLVVVAAKPGVGRIANLLAPIVVNVDTRTGAQIALDPEVYSASAPFDPATILSAPPPPAPQQVTPPPSPEVAAPLRVAPPAPSPLGTVLVRVAPVPPQLQT